MTVNPSVLKFFDKTNNYLHKDFEVDVRSRIVRDHLGDVSGKSILEVGCGDGRIALQFADKNEVALVDISDEMLALARKRVPTGREDHVRFENVDLDSLPSQSQYDIVLAVGLLAHIPSVEQAIAKLTQLTRPGGQLVIQFSDQHSPLSRLSLWRHDRGYQINEIHAENAMQTVAKNRLELTRGSRYSIMVPGMGKLPNALLWWWTMCTYRSSLLSRLASECVWCLKRGESPTE